MITQNNTQIELDTAKSLKKAIAETGLRDSIRFLKKARGTAIAYQILLLIVKSFGLGDNIYRLFDSKRASNYNTSKTALYNLLSKDYNWRTVILNYALKVSNKMHKFDTKNKVRYLIVDDTTIKRNRSKSVELLSWCYDHVFKVSYKGFIDLCLGWSDGVSYLPIDHVLLASSNKDKQLQGVKDSKLDGRTTGAKRRLEAQSRKTDLVIAMLKRALKKGFIADYLLMDSWFCYHNLLKTVINTGIHVICMVKEMKCNRYFLDDSDTKGHTLNQIIKLYANKRKNNICGSVVVLAKNGLKLKLVFIKHNNSKKILTIASTDVNLSTEQICKHYAARWGCECFFKDAKQFLKLEKGNQARSFDSIYAHISIVMITYICLQWINRTNKDNKTKGRQYYEICEEMQSICFSQAIAYIIKSAYIGLEKILDKHISSTKTKKAILDEYITHMSESLSNISYFIQSFLESISPKNLKELLKADEKNQSIYLKSS